MGKEAYEKPEVTKIDFKFNEAIAASACEIPTADYVDQGVDRCINA